jgi:hypothetical protein
MTEHNEESVWLIGKKKRKIDAETDRVESPQIKRVGLWL